MPVLPFNIDPALLSGPICGVVVGLIFALTMFRLVQHMLNEWKAIMERLVRAFEAESKACEERYRQVLDELFRMKDAH